MPRCHCALMDAIRSAAGAGAAGSVLRRSRRRRRRTDQPRRVYRSRQEGAALLAARQGRSHSPSLPLRTRAPAVPVSAPRCVFAAALRRHRSPICTTARGRMRAGACAAQLAEIHTALKAYVLSGMDLMTLAQFMAAAEAYEFFYNKCVPCRQHRDVPRRTYRSGRLQPPSRILRAAAPRGPPAEGSQAALLYGGAGWRCRSTRTRATRSARRSSR